MAGWARPRWRSSCSRTRRWPPPLISGSGSSMPPWTTSLSSPGKSCCPRTSKCQAA
uniref:Uncharacterized protein n=1 Tax=Arundo donax TaxID=35708 RepID=A0A0A8YLU1_ARUDO